MNDVSSAFDLLLLVELNSRTVNILIISFVNSEDFYTRWSRHLWAKRAMYTTTTNCSDPIMWYGDHYGRYSFWLNGKYLLKLFHWDAWAEQNRNKVHLDIWGPCPCAALILILIQATTFVYINITLSDHQNCFSIDFEIRSGCHKKSIQIYFKINFQIALFIGYTIFSTKKI